MTGDHVLVLNTGSSSIKYQLLDMSRERRLAVGRVERIGEESGTLVHEVIAPGGPGGSGGSGEEEGTGDPVRFTRSERYPGHEEGLRAVLDAFERAGPSLDAVRAVGHRVVHGGERFSDPVLIDEEVEKAIDELIPLAPLHNPANLEGIRVARRMFPGLPHVAVFDTAFHRTLPAHASTYAVPRRWTSEFGVRRYGFHGTSHAYVSRRAARLLGRRHDEVNLIVLHLGNGASATAVERGRSVETSMGLTPLEGLVMGTRSGDIDPALPAYLSRVAGLDLAEIDAALNGGSGLLGLTGANDLRRIHELADAGDADAALALEIYCHRIRKYVGAYYAVLGRVDAVVFTAGVGENDAWVRAAALRGLERLGITVDPDRNAPAAGRSEDGPAPGERIISPDGAEIAVLVVPTNEELEIALETLDRCR